MNCEHLIFSVSHLHVFQFRIDRIFDPLIFQPIVICVIWDVDSLDNCRPRHRITTIRSMAWLKEVCKAEAWVWICVSTHISFETIESSQTWPMELRLYLYKQIKQIL